MIQLKAKYNKDPPWLVATFKKKEKKYFFKCTTLKEKALCARGGDSCIIGIKQDHKIKSFWRIYYHNGTLLSRETKLYFHLLLDAIVL